MPPPQISVGAVIVLVGEGSPVLSWFTPTPLAPWKRTAWLSRYLTGRSEVMTTSNSGFEITKTEEEWRKILNLL